MTKRLAESKRIRTAYFGFGKVEVFHAEPHDIVGASYIFQDDVTVVGFELMNYPLPKDAQLNTDGIVHGRMELSRQGRRSQPGVLCINEITVGWTGTMVFGASLAKEIVVMYPDGMGVELDEGEGLNILALLEFTAGAGEHCDWFGECILYYVER